MNQDLQNYVAEARKSSLTDEQIQQNLLSNGWNNQDINEALGKTSATPIPQAPKSSNTKIIVVSLLVLVLTVALSYLFFNRILTKSQSSKIPKLEYVSPSGIFTLSYPSSWQNSPGYDNETVRFIVESNPQYNEYKLLAVTPIDSARIKEYGSDEYLKKISTSFSREDMEIGEKTVRKLKLSVQGREATLYIMPITDEGDGLVASTDSSNPEILKQIEDVLATATIDYDKLIAFSKEKGYEKEIVTMRSIMSGMRASAELYYDSPASYEGLCTSNGRDGFGKAFSNLKQITGNKTKCNDYQSQFVVSAQFPDGKFFCIDSTGFANYISNYHTGKACPSK